MATLAANQVIGQNWKVSSFLGEGACAKVYAVTPNTKINSGLDYEVVAKVIPLPGQQGKKVNKKEQERICNTLNFEYTLYTGLLYGFPYAARNPLKFYGDDPALGVRYLVMERLERDLIGFAKAGTPSPSEVAEIGLQILDGLQWLHKKTFVFVDVKPDNFMLNGNKLYFVDFGLVERVMDNALPGAFNGTPTFSSVSADQGNPMTFRDDIEALGYVLLSLFTEGKLPWSTSTSLQDLQNIKQTTDIPALCAEYGCDEIALLIAHCRALSGKARPNYTQINTWLQAMKSRKTKPKTRVSSSATTATKKSSSSAAPTTVSVPVPVPVSVSVPAKAKKESKRKTARIIEAVTEENEIDAEEEEMVEKRPRTRRTAKSSSDAAEPVQGKKSSAEPAVPVPAAPTPAPVVDVSAPKRKKTKADPVEVCAPVAVAAAASPSPQRVTRSSRAHFSEGTVSPFESRRPPIDTSADKADASEDALLDSLTIDSFQSRAAQRRSTMGLSDGPFSSQASFLSPAAKIARAAPSVTVKVRVVPHAGRQFLHDFRCGEGNKDVTYFIGKDANCDLALSFDEGVSPRHLKLRITSDDVSVLDDGSAAGTMMNGLAIPRKRWKTVQVGYTVLTVGETKIEFL